MTIKKAKRRLTDIKFEKEGAHIALVHSSQGGAANNWHEALVLKATDDVTDEYLEKATMVRVTLPFDDFLEKFFGMWEERAELLTEILGFSDEEGMDEKDRSEMSWEEYKAYCEQEKKDFIDSVEILKSVKQGQLRVSDLNAKSYLSVLLTQSLFEQHQEDIEKAISKENIVTDVNKTVEVELQKAVQANAEKDAKIAELLIDVQKATQAAEAVKQELEVMKAAQAQAKDAARKEALNEVVSADEVEDLFKSLNALDDNGFAIVLKNLKSAADKEAEVFKEKGVAGDDAGKAEEDRVAAILKAKFTTK